MLMLLSAFSPMVQETRRHHGAPLPRIGWWTLLQNLIVMVSGAILAVDGAMTGWKNVKFAIGIIIFIVFLGFFLTRYVLYVDEKRKR